MDEVNVGPLPVGAINPRDFRFVMSLARRYNAIVFWHRDRNGVDWQPLLLPLPKQPPPEPPPPKPSPAEPPPEPPPPKPSPARTSRRR